METGTTEVRTFKDMLSWRGRAIPCVCVGTTTVVRKRITACTRNKTKKKFWLMLALWQIVYFCASVHSFSAAAAAAAGKVKAMVVIITVSKAHQDQMT